MDKLAAIRVFVRTVEAGSITRAAAGLTMPKSTASKALAELETHLGVRLLNRSTRALALTPEGGSYYEHVSTLLSGLNDAEAELRQRGTRLAGRVRVDVHSAMANAILIPALPDFHARYPGIQLALGITDRPIGLIEEGVDCVVRLGRLADTSLIARKLYDDHLVTCASPAYLGRSPAPASPRDLREGHQLIGYFYGQSGEARPMSFDRAGETIEIDTPTMVANDSMGQVAMMLHGMGIGQTYHSTVAAHLASGALVTVLDDWTTAIDPVSILYPERRLNTRVRAFIDWFTAHVNDLELVGWIAPHVA